MIRTKILAAVALAASALASPAMAQEVVSNPGYCAQFYPNANCQNKGPGNPYTDSNYRRGGWTDGYAMMRRGGHARYHHGHRMHHRR